MEIKRFEPSDRPGVLQLLEASLGWLADVDHAAFFAWKHERNPFGASPAWVAVDGGTVVGFRTFLRWQFVDGERIVEAVRAVDTATDPNHRGRRIFTALTERALEELATEGAGFVFNTPNEQSRPGYLKMGWREVGRLPVRFRPRSAAALLRLARARVPADLWSLPSSGGLPAREALDDDEALTALLASLPTLPGLATRRTVEFLRWRYAGFPPLGYRVVPRGRDLRDGFAVLRVRRRGPATEATICDVVLPPAVRGDAGRLVRAALRSSGADYAVRLGGQGVARAGDLPLPRQGPVLTFRGLRQRDPPAISGWHLAMGDVELF